MNYGKAAMRRRAHEIDNKPTKIRKKCGVIFWKIFVVCIIVAGVVGISTGVGAVKGILASAPDISEIDVIPTGYSTTVLASDGSEIATLVAEGSNRQYVTLDEISENLQHAVVAIEDERFYEHNGIDLKGIARALVTDIKAMDFSQGASTITQQLIKNNVLTEQWANENEGKISKLEKMERQVQRKIQEMYIAVELEKKVDDKASKIKEVTDNTDKAKQNASDAVANDVKKEIEADRKMIEKIYNEIDKLYQDFKEKVICEEQEDYCDEMALMYSFKKYLQYIHNEERDFSNEQLEFIVKNIDLFTDTFMEMFWNSDLGNSYYDIKSIIEESITEIKENQEYKEV